MTSLKNSVQAKKNNNNKKLARQNSFQISRILTAVKPETRLQGYCAKLKRRINSELRPLAKIIPCAQTRNNKHSYCFSSEASLVIGRHSIFYLP